MKPDSHPTPEFRYATADDIRRIVALDRLHLPADTLVDRQVFEDWRRKNPRTFTCLVANGAVAGYFSLLPLGEPALARFVAGRIAERDFTADDILSADRDQAPPSELYFYSIVVDEKNRTLVPAVLREFAAEIRRYALRRPLDRIYATAATAAGRRFIEELGFAHRMAGGGRADHHDLYAIEGAAIHDLVQRHGPPPNDDE